MSKGKPRIRPMKTAGTQHLIERTYRESGAFQWVRETYKNAEEAGATRIEFGIEWQAVENLGVYRRVIADNGSGMSPEHLVEYFNTFGGGGKPIGGLHENFGVGSKTSLLPWNPAGMVVVSYQDGEAAMIEVQRDPATGEYGLRLHAAEDDAGEESIEEIVAPYEDTERGCDWSAIKPAWIGDNGTVIVLLGGDPSEDTVLGDRTREEQDIKGISTYLNRRIWQVPANVEVIVDELRTGSRGDWPRTEEDAHGPQAKVGVDRRTNSRTIRGAEYYIDYPVQTYKKGKLAHSGIVDLPSGSKVRWYLWDGERPAVQSYAAQGGYIGALYEDELYDVVSHQATYRSFGITEREVRSKVWLIVQPPKAGADNGRHGVYPRTDRNSLLVKGGPDAGGPLPINEWAREFSMVMPKPLVDAINKARANGGGTINDKAWRDKLADRFGSRWRIPKLRTRKGGPVSVDSTQGGTTKTRIKKVKPASNKSGGNSGGGGGGLNTGTKPGNVKAVKTSVGGGIPSFRLVGADQVEDGMMAVWVPNDPTEPSGVVLVNIEHPVLKAEIEHWASQYPDHLAEQVGQEVANVYGEMAVAKVAHSEHLKGIIPAADIEEQLRSPAALTMSLLGLIGEEAVLAPRIGGKFSKKVAA
jgi:hypothetical protein